MMTVMMPLLLPPQEPYVQTMIPPVLLPLQDSYIQEMKTIFLQQQQEQWQ